MAQKLNAMLITKNIRIDKPDTVIGACHTQRLGQGDLKYQASLGYRDHVMMEKLKILLSCQSPLHDIMYNQLPQLLHCCLLF